MVSRFAGRLDNRANDGSLWITPIQVQSETIYDQSDMLWKFWPLWLRGGVIAVTTTYFVLVCLFQFVSRCYPYHDPIRGFIPSCVPYQEFVMIGFTGLAWLGLPATLLFSHWHSWFAAFQFVLVFLIGATVGAIFGLKHIRILPKWLKGGLVASLIGAFVALLPIALDISCRQVHMPAYDPEAAGLNCLPYFFFSLPFQWIVFGFPGQYGSGFYEAGTLAVLFVLRLAAWLLPWFFLGSSVVIVRKFATTVTNDRI